MFEPSSPHAATLNSCIQTLKRREQGESDSLDLSQAEKSIASEEPEGQPAGHEIKQWYRQFTQKPRLHKKCNEPEETENSDKASRVLMNSIS
jgi:hypothetical protein